MRTRGWFKVAGLVWSLVFLVACSGSSPQAAVEPENPVPASVEEQCQTGARQVADRLDMFLSDFDGMTPEAFLAQDEIEGLTEFQNDVAQLITNTANQSSTLCDLNGLQSYVDQELDAVGEQGLLANYVVSTIRFGGTLQVADVEVGPDDDLAVVLSLLDSGSSVMLLPGTFEIDTSLLIQRDIVIVGAGTGETIVQSSSPDAAVAVFGAGKLTLRDLTLEHVGQAPASVILAFGAPVDLERVVLAGATNDDETTGGNGLLLSTGSVNAEGVTTPADPDGAEAESSRIVDTEITGNSIAGIAVTGDLTPLIANNRITENTLCGLCFLGESGGQVLNNTVERNEFGIQMGDDSDPLISGNTVQDNAVVGMVFLGRTTATISENIVADNGDVGLAVQEAAAPLIDKNTIDGQPFGITLVGTSTAQVTTNTVTESEVGMQVAEAANPTVTDNEFRANTNIGLLHRDTSSGRFERNLVQGEQSVGVLIEGTATPAISEARVEGSEVSISYREEGAGTLANSLFDGPSIAIQIEDQAAPEITNNSIRRPLAAGIVIRSEGQVVVRENVIEDPETLGIGTAGQAVALIENNTIRGGESAASIVDQSAPEFRNNSFEGQVVAIQIGDQATPALIENTIAGATGAGIVFRDQAAGSATANTIVNPVSVGIQIVGEAAPIIAENVVVADIEIPASDDAQSDPETDPESGPETDPETDPESGAEEGPETAADEGAEATENDGPPDTETAAGESAETEAVEIESTVGILYAGDSGGELNGNQVLGFVIGVQISENAGPNLTENTVDGGAANGVGFLFRDMGAGRARLNRTASHSIGFQISDAAAPELVDNTVEQAIDVAFLVQGTASPRLQGNSCPVVIPGIAVLDQASPDIGQNACPLASG